MVSNLPSLTHANRHAAGGPDAISPADIGAQPAGNYVAVSPTLRALRFLGAYGDSKLAETGNCSANYFDRLIAAIRPQVWFNGGVGGYAAGDINAVAFGAFSSIRQGSASGVGGSTAGLSTFPPKPFVGGLTIYDAGHGDSRKDSTPTGAESTAVAQTKARAAFTNGIDAWIRVQRAQAKLSNRLQLSVTTTSGSATVTGVIQPAMQGSPISGTGIPAASYVGTPQYAGTALYGFKLSSSPTSQVDVTATATGAATATLAPVRTGAWTTGAATTECSGGTVAYTSTAGDKVRYYFTVPAGQTVTAAFVGLGDDVDAGAAVSAAITYAVDGGSASAAVAFTSQAKKSGGGPNNNSAQLAVPVGTFTAGTHYVEIVHAGSTGQYLWDDCLLVESATPQTVVILKTYQLPASGYASSGGSYAVEQVYGGLMDTVAARFPADGSVVVFDPNEAGAGFDYTTMVGNTDGLNAHLNDTGMAWMAGWLLGKLNALPGRLGLNRPT